jgi:hypothetical protein
LSRCDNSARVRAGGTNDRLGLRRQSAAATFAFFARTISKNICAKKVSFSKTARFSAKVKHQ